MTPAEPDPIGTDLRRARRARKLSKDAACVICGQDDPEVLRRARRSLLEQHHLGGEANDAKLTVFLCLNHHRIQTARQATTGIELDREPDRTHVERLVSVLRGLALFFDSLAAALMAWAETLAAHVARLDANCPGWRQNEASAS
jgi:hypothetical protein